MLPTATCVLTVFWHNHATPKVLVDALNRFWPSCMMSVSVVSNVCRCGAAMAVCGWTNHRAHRQPPFQYSNRYNTHTL